MPMRRAHRTSTSSTLALGVDGAPKIDHAAIDFQIDFVQMPSHMGLESPK
jgi:hypothetical protein